MLRVLKWIRSLGSRTYSAVLQAPAPLFVALLLTMGAGAAFLASSGMRGLADFRDARNERIANNRASSPWAYRDEVIFAKAAGAPSAETVDTLVTVVLRVDSLSGATETGDSCAIMRAVGDALKAHSGIVVRYVALSSAHVECEGRLQGEVVNVSPPLVRAPLDSLSRFKNDTTPGRAAPSRRKPAELGDPAMRWAILDAQARSIYSSSAWPEERTVLAVVDVIRGKGWAAGVQH